MPSGNLRSLRRKQSRLLSRLSEVDDLARRCGFDPRDTLELQEALRAGAVALEGVSSSEPLSPCEGDLIIYIDGASRGNPGPAGIGVRVCDASGETLEEIGHYIGIATNNEAEYRGLLTGLREGARRGAKRLRVYSDSQLVTRQIQGKYRVRQERLAALYGEARSLISRFDEFEIVHIGRERNQEADSLANAAIDEALK